MFANSQVPVPNRPQRLDHRWWAALLFSLFFVHAPLLYILLTYERDAFDLNAHQRPQVLMVDLKKAAPLRVADIEKPALEEIPANPSAQALYNSTVKEETVAALSKATPKSPVPAGKPQKTATKKPQRAAKTSPKTANTDPLAPPMPLTLNDKLKFLQAAQDQQEKQRHNDLFAHQSQAILAPKIFASAPAGGDFFPDYKLGNRTYLNTLANPNTYYFVELRRKFRFAFNPLPVLRRHIDKLPKGKIEVVWGVSLSAAGEVRELVLLRQSGLPTYDQEGRRTISSSAPFSKPPTHLLDKDGLLNMAWTFTVYL